MYNIESNSFNIMIIVIYFIYICKKFLQIYIMELAMTVKETIGKRIKEERTRLNLSQEDLAQKIGWKEHVKISSIERGERDIKAWELSKIASVLKIDMNKLMGDLSSCEASLPFVFWRRKPKRHEEIQAEFLKKSEDYSLVERLLKVEKKERKLPHEDLNVNSANDADVYRMAASVRDQLGLGKFPAKSLAQILEDIYGVKFIIEDLDDGGSAATSISSSLGPCILLNCNEVPWRQHFSIAHELFHLITWNECLFQILHENSLLHEKNERLAESFAAGLLLPEENVRDEIAKLLAGTTSINYVEIISLSRQFEVSALALIYRMANLQIISWSKAKEINVDPEFIRLNTLANQSRKRGLLLSDRFLRLSYQAYATGKISRAKFAKMLGVPLIDLGSVLEERGLVEDIESCEIEISNS